MSDRVLKEKLKGRDVAALLPSVDRPRTALSGRADRTSERRKALVERTFQQGEPPVNYLPKLIQ
ncbi:MAG: hypothetical protein DBX00_08410 [Verrucomicrobia bacterium]|nr:MAG: hypothetical protein DBX00_08410 [Verrucomicrobiota bacterium]